MYDKYLNIKYGEKCACHYFYQGVCTHIIEDLSELTNILGFLRNNFQAMKRAKESRCAYLFSISFHAEVLLCFLGHNFVFVAPISFNHYGL